MQVLRQRGLGISMHSYGLYLVLFAYALPLVS